MVNLRDLQIGQAVRFAMGGQDTVKDMKSSYSETVLTLENTDFTATWNNDGKFIKGSRHPLDIEEIVEPEFQWSSVKPGMAFIDEEEDIVIYIGPSFSDSYEDAVICEKDDEEIYHYDKDVLTRSPEDDKV